MSSSFVVSTGSRVTYDNEGVNVGKEVRQEAK